MTRTEIFTQSSAWYILLCLLIGGAYAFLLYSKKPVWNNTINRVLAVVRFLVVSFICFLLLSPIVKHIKNVIEKPILVIAVDNSESLAEVHDNKYLRETLQKLGTEVKEIEEEFKIEYQTLEGNRLEILDSVKFNYHVTNLSSFLTGLQSKYEDQNLSQVILLSDGIFNQGISPDYQPYSFKIHPLAMGDTTSKKDLNLKNLLYNKIAYRGNKFPVVAEFTAEGFSSESVKVNLEQNGKVIQTQNIKIKGGVNQTTFYTSSDQPGMQHYTVQLDQLPGEFTLKNNTAHAYVDVIDNKEKILLVGLAPHPDIKAIKSAIEIKENYEFQIYIPGIDTPPKDPKFDLIIFHQIPDQSGSTNSVVTEYKSKSKNHLFVLGNQSGYSQFNNLTETIDIFPRGAQKDEVFAVFNKEFSRFTVEENKNDVLSKLPPVVVPFAEYQMPPNHEVLLYQRVGNVETNKPLVVMGSSDNGQKIGVITGNGIWQWRLNEYALNKNTLFFDEMISKTIQYLSSKEDKRKFRVYPVTNEVFENESVVFETEVYNNIYEKIYGQKIDLELINESGKKTNYNYVNSQNNSKYQLGGLPTGIYKYAASTIIDGKKEVSSGQFIVKEIQIESLNITANHRLLKELSNNTEGKFFYANDIDKLSEFLKENESQGRVHSFEENLELINMKWLFFLVLILISFEWTYRKFNGSY